MAALSKSLSVHSDDRQLQSFTAPPSPRLRAWVGRAIAAVAALGETCQ